MFLVGCGSSATDQAFCAFCADDSQCGGNPCYADASGMKFCGAPCSRCPLGSSCQNVTGTSGKSAQTCVPDTGCTTQHADGGADGNNVVTDPSQAPVGGPVGPTGGTVDKLLFGFTGDTRPDMCSTAYPSAIIQGIFNGLAQQHVQFVVDQGDHMFQCINSNPGLVDARGQMLEYTKAAHLFGNTVFMTMGNHECTNESTALCTLASYGANANYTAFMDAMKPISTKPYYRFDVMTSAGLAVFLVVADDVWDAAEQSWLTTQLTDADAHAKYTIVSKHHPDGNADYPQFQDIYNLVTSHKYTLFLTGHTHEFRQQFNDPRAFVIGIGGAPLDHGTWWGYGVVQQNTDATLTITVYDQATNTARNTYMVGPQ
jgi:hypothetical protein